MKKKSVFKFKFSKREPLVTSTAILQKMFLPASSSIRKDAKRAQSALCSTGGLRPDALMTKNLFI